MFPSGTAEAIEDLKILILEHERTIEKMEARLDGLKDADNQFQAELQETQIEFVLLNTRSQLVEKRQSLRSAEKMLEWETSRVIQPIDAEFVPPAYPRATATIPFPLPVATPIFKEDLSHAARRLVESCTSEDGILCTDCRRLSTLLNELAQAFPSKATNGGRPEQPEAETGLRVANTKV